jgi:phosphatidylethanolamine/phosphatidyl-N-methylethanolamine N-methyltransferase
MSLPALLVIEREFEKQKRIFELKTGALGREIGRHIQIFERKKGALERKIEQQFENHRRRFEEKIESQKKKLESRFRRFEQKNGIRFDDEVRFIRTWIEKPLTTGAVAPSSKALARTMASYIDPSRPGPIIELGPRGRYPEATVIQGDAYSLKRLLAGLLQQPAAAVVSGLPLFNKPLRMRLRLLFEAFGLMSAGAPFVQFTYNAVPPIPKRLERVSADASERIWMNIPPARVWVYRRS